MKQLFTCLLLLLLVTPAWAAEQDDSDEEVFINNVVAIVLDEDMDSKELEKSIKDILLRVRKNDFLGNAAVNAKIYNMSSIDLGEVYGKKDYPAFEKYRDELFNLNSALYALIATEAFAAQGINAPEAKAWLRKCKDAQQRYAKVKLPPRRDDGFTHLESAARYYYILSRERDAAKILRTQGVLEVHRKYVDGILEKVTVLE
ncbi:MAG: hypothetical protein KH208_14765 [Desulfovibrio sp.]|uniref:hypothetical protein n=1 Tax=Desulfovibrio sp. TaxID=885 RepID=UPI0025C1798A|nr:hypothetical protein [Desulfovibrio sp.]MBS6831091.1 hypothetical protein [Desulfovibrio sp.]